VVKAKYLLIAGNAYLPQGLDNRVTSKSMPCGSQIVVTEPLSEKQARSLIKNNYCVEDCNYLLDYYRLTGDKRLVFGGGVVYGARDPANIDEQANARRLEHGGELAYRSGRMADGEDRPGSGSLDHAGPKPAARPRRSTDLRCREWACPSFPC